MCVLKPVEGAVRAEWVLQKIETKLRLQRGILPSSKQDRHVVSLLHLTLTSTLTLASQALTDNEQPITHYTLLPTPYYLVLCMLAIKNTQPD